MFDDIRVKLYQVSIKSNKVIGRSNHYPSLKELYVCHRDKLPSDIILAHISGFFLGQQY